MIKKNIFPALIYFHLLINLKKTVDSMKDGKVLTLRPYRTNGDIILKKEPIIAGEENKFYNGRAIIADSNTLPFRLEKEGVAIGEFRTINDIDSFLTYLCETDGNDGVDILDSSISGVTLSKHIPTDRIKRNKPNLKEFFPEHSIHKGELSYNTIGERTLLSLIPLFHRDIQVDIHLIKQTSYGQDPDSEIKPEMGVLVHTNKEGLKELFKIDYDQRELKPLIECTKGGVIGVYSRFKNYGSGPVEVRKDVINQRNMNLESLMRICAN